MKLLLTILAVPILFILSAQDNQYANTYVCQKGKVHFLSVTAMENIEATTQSAVCIINTQTKRVNAKIQQTSFTFHDKLMQEHFNENYMESDKYPYSVLDMVIVENIDFTKDGTYDVTLKGTLEMHGVKNDREIKGKLIIKNGQLVSATAAFEVKLADHKIKIPSIVGINISESVKVDVDFALQKFQK